ncbi:hypothetical protein [Methanococcus maripaludis]|uniref:Uncharacterized protein n=4 Tax=Methanococcus maripaludis TaxID=39152 RepID=A0A8T3W019_METMI|nr:hypothetical protein [Methanococcus maripaludis]AEK20301.1 hypothetical protein GYY_07215 [Methanococcus maripaludis X1]MBG0768874.1 hypothetical protein [Methanococcus maripaludis]BAP61618.1 hypothetical protein MMKA1_15010 [Methanococcus maripaludis KA1]BAP63469.1 hypothetical protein MMOS7_13830 [Methanococcus maripaludis OS7]
MYKISFKNLIFAAILAIIVMILFALPETYINISADNYSPKTGDIINIDVDVIKKSNFGTTTVEILLPNGTTYLNTVYGKEPKNNTVFNEKYNISETYLKWTFNNEDKFGSSINILILNSENKTIKATSKTEFLIYDSLNSDKLIISAD